jgi:NitT/TauT family transport system ATP-binding protein
MALNGQPAVLTVRNLTVTFPGEEGGLQAVLDLTFEVRAEEFVCILGPSGSGKSTLLRVLSGLLAPTSGEVQYTGGRPPRIGYVFQQANLMPWRTAIENITLPLEMQGIPAEEACRRAQELIELTGLSGFEETWPRDLSGGMAQRVAIARALIQDPDLLLLDEPFGALDALTRERMGAELLQLWQARRKTVLMVTHSISEALLLSDRVLVFTQRPGRLALDYTVRLPRPRSDEMRYTAEFAAMARELKAAIG